MLKIVEDKIVKTVANNSNLMGKCMKEAAKAIPLTSAVNTIIAVSIASAGCIAIMLVGDAIIDKHTEKELEKIAKEYEESEEDK